MSEAHRDFLHKVVGGVVLLALKRANGPDDVHCAQVRYGESARPPAQSGAAKVFGFPRTFVHFPTTCLISRS